MEKNINIVELISAENIIIESFSGKVIEKVCRFIGQEKNKYWLVLNINTNEQYYLMECTNKLTKIDIDSIKKVIDHNYI